MNAGSKADKADRADKPDRGDATRHALLESATRVFARYGYDTGVPMGGDLKGAPAGKAPAFLIRAVRDPDRANLDRVQMVKGWLDADGDTHERVWDVAVSDGRTIGKDGRCKAHPLIQFQPCLMKLMTDHLALV